MKAIPSFLLAIFVSISARAEAVSSPLFLKQLNHRIYTMSEGLPSDIHELTQTTDGTLWIAASSGLVRFDGARFLPYPGPSEEGLPRNYTGVLAAAPDGGLWVGYAAGGASLVAGGHVRNFTVADGFPVGSVEQFSLEHDGSLWASTVGGLARFDGHRWDKVSLPGVSNYKGVLVDSRGTVWVATAHALLARPASEQKFREVTHAEFGADTTHGALRESPDGKIWAIGHEIVRVDRPETLEGASVVTTNGFPGNAAGPLFFDKEGNLWTSQWNNSLSIPAILRVPARELAADGRHAVAVNPAILSAAEGFPDGARFFLQDREGNIWIVTESALHRLSHSNLTHEHLPCTHPAVAAGDAGTLWAACRAEPATLSELRDGAIVSQQKTPTFTVAYRDQRGTVWFAGDTALGRVQGEKLVLIPLPQELKGSDAQALVRDNEGALWLSLACCGVVRYIDGTWSKVSGPLQKVAVVEIADDDRGTLWFGYSDSTVAHLVDGNVQVFGLAQGLAIGTVQQIVAEKEEVWVGGELGLAYLDQGHFVLVKNASGAPFRGVSAIIRSRTGDFWLNTVNGIERIPQGEIRHLKVNPTYPVRSIRFNYQDGAGSANQRRPLPSAVETSDGRLWFVAAGSDAVSMDLTGAIHNTLPPPVTIWSLTSGRYAVTGLSKNIQLPIHTTNLQIDYGAGSLTVPERVQFRYKLEGLDSEWQDVGARREALYTNLGPGQYRFRVVASNNDGVWNMQGAALEFTIPPAFYQARWFHCLCAMVCVALLAILYRARARQVADQVRDRLEARLAERERIARDLHDTLLQGMQGSIWQLQGATNHLTPDLPARQEMQRALDRADKLLEESRDRVKDLRPALREVADLAQSLATEGEELAPQHSAKFRVTVQGERRDLHPIVREEAFLIGCEALRNAFRHAGAKVIEAELTYDEAALRLRIRDDGRGIRGSVLEAGGSPGHFGLIGMQERAKKLGGHIEIWSKPEAGTEIDLRVPANVAYVRLGRHSGVRSLFAIVRRRAHSL